MLRLIHRFLLFLFFRLLHLTFGHPGLLFRPSLMKRNFAARPNALQGLRIYPSCGRQCTCPPAWPWRRDWWCFCRISSSTERRLRAFRAAAPGSLRRVEQPVSRPFHSRDPEPRSPPKRSEKPIRLCASFAETSPTRDPSLPKKSSAPPALSRTERAAHSKRCFHDQWRPK